MSYEVYRDEFKKVDESTLETFDNALPKLAADAFIYFWEIKKSYDDYSITYSNASSLLFDLLDNTPLVNKEKIKEIEKILLSLEYKEAIFVNALKDELESERNKCKE